MKEVLKALQWWAFCGLTNFFDDADLWMIEFLSMACLWIALVDFPNIRSQRCFCLVCLQRSGDHRSIRFQINSLVESLWSYSSASRLASRHFDKHFSYGEQKSPDFMWKPHTRAFRQNKPFIDALSYKIAIAWEKPIQTVSLPRPLLALD